MKLKRVGMKANERVKAQEMVDRILSGNFDWNDVDNLFMRLRAYSSGHQCFKEIADFVAHNMTRDRGISHRSLEKFYYAVKYGTEYCLLQSQRKLDLSGPFPLYIKQHMIYRVDDIKPDELWQMFQLKPEQLKEHFRTLFKEDEGTENVILIPSNVRPYTQKAIAHMLGSFVVKPLFTSDDLIAELISLLHKNKFIFDEDAIMVQREKIILCVMLLMHHTQFDFGESPLGKCGISSDFGSLDVWAEIPIKVKDGGIGWASYQIFTSDLSPDKFCDESLFVVEELLPDQPGKFVKKLNFNQDLCLKNSKLSAVHS